jgi:cytochrome c-type biogenesis protein CcmE
MQTVEAPECAAGWIENTVAFFRRAAGTRWTRTWAVVREGGGVEHHAVTRMPRTCSVAGDVTDHNIHVVGEFLGVLPVSES